MAKRAASIGCSVIDIDTRGVELSTSPFLDDVAAVVLAHPGPHHPDTIALLDRGIDVLSVGDDVSDVEAMMWESERAVRCGATLVVGAGMSPGLVGLIARHLANSLATIDEIHVAIHGTAGPACARQHHRALSGHATAYDDGAFVSARAGTGLLARRPPGPPRLEINLRWRQRRPQNLHATVCSGRVLPACGRLR